MDVIKTLLTVLVSAVVVSFPDIVFSDSSSEHIHHHGAVVSSKLCAAEWCRQCSRCFDSLLYGSTQCESDLHMYLRL